MKRTWAHPAISLLVAVAACGPTKTSGDGEKTKSEAARLSTSGQGASFAAEVASSLGQSSHDASVDLHRGSMSARLPLPPLPAQVGFEPDIALTYGGSSRDLAQGLGVGFSLDVSSIEMTNDWGVPYRGQVDVATGDLTARMSLDGARLVWVKTDAVNGKPRIEYRLDAGEQMLRVFRYPEGGTVRARDASGSEHDIDFKGFLVVHPDGRQDVYTEDPAIAEGAQLPTVYFATRWPLQYAVGPIGELITYEYEKGDDARSYLRSVTFGGGRSKYVFETAARTKADVTYGMGFPQGTRRLTSKITAFLDGQPMHQWCMVHASFDGGSAKIVTHPDCQALADEDFAADRDALAGSLDQADKVLGIYRFGWSVAPFSKTTPADPLIRFRYSDIQADDLGGHSLVYDYDVPGVYGFGPTGGSELMDVNADGLDDILRYAARDGASYPAYNQADLELPSTFVRGTGIVLEKIVGGVRMREIPHFDETAQSSSVFLLGDFDGNGRADIVQAVREGARSRLYFFRSQAVASQPFAPAVRDALIDVDLSRLLQGRARVIDVNGDGKDDIVLATPGSTDTVLTAYVNVMQPGDEAVGFVTLPALKFPFRGGPGTSLDNPSYRFLDVNGDGLVDFAILKVGTSGDKGLCVYENQGGVTAYAGDKRAKLARGALLFGDPAANDAICVNGYFLPIAGLANNQNLNAIWLIDVNRDGLSDLVDLGPTGKELHAWIGRGRAGFSAMRTIGLNAAVAVDPNNKWNTRVVDADGDGVSEILVYEPTATGGRIKIVDFNRQGIKNAIGPNLIVGMEEGPGLRQAFEYSTVTDELVRDRRRLGFGDPRVAGIPSAAAVIKRHFVTAVGSAPTVREYQYRYPRYDEVDHGLMGFGEVDSIEYGDATVDTLVTRQTYELSGAAYDRFLAAKVRSEQSFAPALTAAQEKRITESAGGPATGIDGASRTSITWSEEAYAPRAILAQHSAQWSAVPRETTPKPTLFVRLTHESATSCGTNAACEGGAVTERTLTYDEPTNRVASERTDRAAVSGPQDTSVPARSTLRTLAYDPTWQARGVLTAIAEQTTTALPSNRVLASIETTFAADRPLPVRVESKVLVDADALADLPDTVRAGIPTETARAVTYVHDAFGNVIEKADALGTIETLGYDAAGLRVIRSVNALGHTTSYCYGTAGCDLEGGGATALPSRSIAPTHVRSPQGETRTVTYDERWRPVVVRDSAGSETRFAYRDADAAGASMVRASERRWSDADAAQRGEPAFVQHLVALRADGLPIAQVEEGEEGGARITSSAAYNRRLQATIETVPSQTSVDIASLFASGRLPALPASSCGVGIATCTSFDALGRPARIIDASGRITTSLAYEPWGQRAVQSLEDASGATTRARSTIGVSNETYAVIDEQGAVHRFERDERGALRRLQTAGEAGPRLALYDSSGAIVLDRIAGGATRVWTRDTRGRLIEERTWDRTLQEWERVATTYDRLDRPTRVMTSSSKRPDGWDDTMLVYDAVTGDDVAANRGRLLRATTESIAFPERFGEDFAYDRDGRVVSRRASYDAGEMHREYVETWAFALDGSGVSHGDPFGNVFGLRTTSWGATRSIDWAPRGSTAAPLMTDARYDGRGQLGAYVVSPNRTHRSFGYDLASGRLSQLRACVGDDADACTLHTLQDVAYSRGADGRLSSSRDAAGTTSYGYSPRGELRQAQAPNGDFAYSYGAAGELAMLGEGTERTFTPADGAGAMPLPRSGDYRLDAFGRVVAGGAVRAAEYDPKGNLRRVEVDGKVIVYGHGPNGERISKRTYAGTGDGTASEVVVYPSADTRDDGAERQSIVRIGGRQAALIVNEAKVLSIVDDQRGATVAIADDSGNVVASADYTPFGKSTVIANGASSGPLASLELVFGFTGQLTDPDTGFVHMGTREYVPELASFSSPDSYILANPEYCVSSPLECHLYTYVAHDPMNAIDPDGQMAHESAEHLSFRQRITENAQTHREANAAETATERSGNQLFRNLGTQWSASGERHTSEDLLEHANAVHDRATVAGTRAHQGMTIATARVTRPATVGGLPVIETAHVIAENGGPSQDGKMFAMNASVRREGFVRGYSILDPIGGMHAEQRIMGWALANQYTVENVASSRPVCRECAHLLSGFDNAHVVARETVPRQ